MDKYDFQVLLRNYGYSHSMGGGIYSKGEGSIGVYRVSNRFRQITHVETNHNKLKVMCLLHGIRTEYK